MMLMRSSLLKKGMYLLKYLKRRILYWKQEALSVKAHFIKIKGKELEKLLHLKITL